MSAPAATPDHDQGEHVIRHSRDVWGSAVTVAISALALQRSISYGIRGTSQVIGPGTFPAIVSAALLLCGLFWAWQAWRGTVPQPEEPIHGPDGDGVRRIVITVTAMLIPALVFELIDFRLTLFAMSFVIMRWVFNSTVLLSSVTAAALSAICYFGLSLGLGMVLPVSF